MRMKLSLSQACWSFSFFFIISSMEPPTLKRLYNCYGKKRKFLSDYIIAMAKTKLISHLYKFNKSMHWLLCHHAYNIYIAFIYIYICMTFLLISTYVLPIFVISFIVEESTTELGEYSGRNLIKGHFSYQPFIQFR